MQMNEPDWAMAQRAETLRLSGAYEQAIEIFEQLPNKYPDNAWVKAHLGTTYRQLMDYGEAKGYLYTAVEKKPKYYWAHAQLGETYRLWAITEYYQDQKKKYIDLAIEHFTIALDAEAPKDSHYAWALAHLGATYRLEIPGGIIEKQLRKSKKNLVFPQSEEGGALKRSIDEALKCLNRAIELIPTYAWAWGMRATVYRLAQEYENSFWDLGVLTVIAPEMEVLQHSSSPVPFLESRWVNLHEHAFLYFYLTKTKEYPELIKEEQKQKADQERKRKKRHYGRAIACAQQALILKPGDLIAQLILIVIEGDQKKDPEDGFIKKPEDEKIKEELCKFFKYAESEVFETCEKVLRHLIKLGRVSKEDLEKIRCVAGEEHKLTKMVLEDVINAPCENIGPEPKLWLWKNFALTQTCSNVLWLLSDLSVLLNEDSIIGKAEPYQELAGRINPSHTIERLYQDPVLSEKERSNIFIQLSPVLTA